MQTCQGVKLVIDHENLESEDSIKYLSVVIHKNLTWNEHIETLIAKVNQRFGLLNRIKYLLPLDARVALYNGLIRPLFDFPDTIWGDREIIGPFIRGKIRRALNKTRTVPFIRAFLI